MLQALEGINGTTSSDPLLQMLDGATATTTTDPLLQMMESTNDTTGTDDTESMFNSNFAMMDALQGSDAFAGGNATSNALAMLQALNNNNSADVQAVL